MWQFWEIQPHIVHSGIRTANVRCERPALDKIPAHMIQVKPVEDEVGCVIHGQLVHVPNDFLARRKIRSEFLLLEEFVEFGKGVTLIPESTLGHKPLAEGIDRVIEIYRSAQQREDVVA